MPLILQPKILFSEIPSLKPGNFLNLFISNFLFINFKQAFLVSSKAYGSYA